MSEQLLITSGILLNFGHAPFYLPHPYTHQLFRYPGTEWRFHAMKTLVAKDSLKRRWAMHDKIAKCKDPRVAKRLGRELKIDTEKWDVMSFGIMLSANLAKFTQNGYARKALLETRNRVLVEHRPDPIWGDNMDGSGRNDMGRILTDVREALRSL